MKTWKQIIKKSQRGDWERVASIAGCSRKNVEMISRNERTDNFNVQKIFSEVINHREKLTLKYSRKSIAA